MVREFKLEIDLRKKINWNGVDTTYSDGVIKFCKEWLFPRYKFFHDDWMIYSEDRRSLSSMMLKHCAVPDGEDREDAWDRVVAPMVAKKYADMRCNINNDVRKAFQGMKLFHRFGSIGIIISPISALLADPNRSKIDPDTLIKGISPFFVIRTETNLYPFYKYIAQYVRKLHSD
jgi:hypothetical protein